MPARFSNEVRDAWSSNRNEKLFSVNEEPPKVYIEVS